MPQRVSHGFLHVEQLTEQGLLQELVHLRAHAAQHQAAVAGRQFLPARASQHDQQPKHQAGEVGHPGEIDDQLAEAGLAGQILQFSAHAVDHQAIDQQVMSLEATIVTPSRCDTSRYS